MTDPKAAPALGGWKLALGAALQRALGPIPPPSS